MKISRHIVVAAIACGTIIMPAGAVQLCTFAPSACVAPTGGAGESQRTENRAYLGLEWSLGGKVKLEPQFVMGFRSLTIKDTGDVSGGDLGLRLKLFSGFAVDSLRLVYVGGNRDVQGNLGGGYSFSSSTPIITGGIQSAYSRLGVDYLTASKTFMPFVQFNSLRKPQRASPGGPLTCPSGYTLTDAGNTSGVGVGASGSQVNEGKTCANLA